MMTDSLSSYNVDTKPSTRRHKRLMIDLKSAKECYKKFKIDDFTVISSKHMIADTLTKVNGESILKDTLHIAQLSHPLQQWFI